MTVVDVVGALARRWYVLLLGLALTGGLGLLAKADHGVYYLRTEVVFLAPQSALYPNNLTTSSGSLISIAGLVERALDGGADARCLTLPKVSGADVRLVDQGVRDGCTIRLPDIGGQWAHNFENQVLDVEVAGPSSEVVETRGRDLVDAIGGELATLQDAAGVVPENRVTTYVSATDSVVLASGRPSMALAAIAALGVTLSAVAAVGWDRLRARRR